ncbi:MAG: P27 family phage terminase small subunit [Tsuneonella sp.]
MGRRAKPTHLKVVENSRDRRSALLRAGEPQPKDAPLEPSEWLTPDQVAIWNHAIASMPTGLLKPIDTDLLVSWTIAVDLRNQAAQRLANSTLLVKGQSGNVSISPYQRMFNTQTANMKMLAAEFGFSPAARTGIAHNEEIEDDPTDRFFR